MPHPRIGVRMNYMRLGSHHQFHVRDKYIDAVFAAGALPCPLPCTDDKAVLRQYLEPLGAVIVIGGLDYPPELYGEALHPKTELAHERRVKGDFSLLETALELEKPLLGICAGMQLLNVFFGGALIQHIPELDTHYGEKQHPVEILGGRWLPRIYGEGRITVNSNHHQAADPNRIGAGLKVVAQAEDGMVEALEHDSEQMVLGIQWHPERMADSALGGAVFRFLVKLAKT